jgi:hypothetical protein
MIGTMNRFLALASAHVFCVSLFALSVRADDASCSLLPAKTVITFDQIPTGHQVYEDFKDQYGISFEFWEKLSNGYMYAPGGRGFFFGDLGSAGVMRDVSFTAKSSEFCPTPWTQNVYGSIGNGSARDGYYDIVSHSTFNSCSPETITLPVDVSEVHAIPAKDQWGGSPSTAMEVSSVSFRQVENVVLTQPAPGDKFALADDNYTSVQVPFEATTPSGASGSLVLVDAKLEYATSGGKGNYTQSDTILVQTGGTADTHKYASVGGKLTLRAKLDGTGIESCANAYVVGTQIPDDAITERLDRLYATGATPGLLTGIAQVESSYRQFTQMNLYGASARWPYESYDGGSHIGLMQVETKLGMDYVWDWTVNTREGHRVFVADKLPPAGRNAAKIMAAHPGLPPPTGKQLEDIALVYYGEHGSDELDQQYYTVGADPVTGLPTWVVNTAGNPLGVAYANKIRSCIRTLGAPAPAGC